MNCACTPEPTVPSIVKEMKEMAASMGSSLDIEAQFIPGALEVLRAGDEERYNGIIADAAERMVAESSVDTIALAMFSMACAGPTVQSRLGAQAVVLTSPEAAVGALKDMLAT